MPKIKLEDLTKESTPCEICVAINERQVQKNNDGNYYDSTWCSETRKTSFAMGGGSACIPAYRTLIKLQYLSNKNLVEISESTKRNMLMREKEVDKNI
jgi:hypothetical protein